MDVTGRATDGEITSYRASARQRWTARLQEQAQRESLHEKARRTADDGYLDGLALRLYGFCAGVERILEDIARGMEESLCIWEHLSPDIRGEHQRGSTL